MSALCGSARLSPCLRGIDVLHVFKGAKAGLSPRVRGNPRQPRALMIKRKVYPRAYGGTLKFIHGGFDRLGSIPARTGNPFT